LSAAGELRSGAFAGGYPPEKIRLGWVIASTVGELIAPIGQEAESGRIDDDANMPMAIAESGLYPW